MFILGGYIFDPRLRYSSTVWTSAGSNSIVIAGRMWLSAELMRVVDVPYGGTFTPYTAGLTAWVPMDQAVLAF